MVVVKLLLVIGLIWILVVAEIVEEHHLLATVKKMRVYKVAVGINERQMWNEVQCFMSEHKMQGWKTNI